MILGLDVSTSIVGIAILHTDGRLACLKHVDLRKVEGHIAKAMQVWDELDKLGHMCDIKEIFIEDKLSGFSGGRTSAQTIQKLAAFNGIVTWLAFDRIFGHPDNIKNVVHLHPSTVKAALAREGLVVPKGGDKKALTLEFVSRRTRIQPELNRNGRPQPWNYDRADAYCVALAGILKKRKNAKADEAQGPPQDTGAGKAEGRRVRRVLPEAPGTGGEGDRSA